MSPRRDPWTGKDTAQCFGMLALSAGALTACTGHLTIDHIRVYAQTAWAYMPLVAAGLGATVLGVAVLLLVARHLRAWLVNGVRRHYVYGRRWAAVLDRLGLTVVKGEHTSVPRLGPVVRRGTDDMVTVEMLPGQSPVGWHEQSAALASEFGASSARVGFGPRPHRDLVITFSRVPAPKREQLALPAPAPHPLPLRLPDQQQAKPRLAIRLSGLSLQIVWARVQTQGQNGVKARIPVRNRFGLRGELRWATCATAI
ncbi:hypothetical protein [Nocardia brasiliensis]|uniref:hypothetical protein n=1 Tax=Nocardia brasiliensis TaxID=37326 RepID=UPI0024578AA7|nr:hypothetical protein [Nocardia brasiliensis]